MQTYLVLLMFEQCDLLGKLQVMLAPQLPDNACHGLTAKSIVRLK